MPDAPSMPSSEDLIAAARGGDERAYRRLVEPYRAPLRAHCYRMLGSVADADDALQDALVGAWQGLGGFQGRSSIRGWLYTIATHACLRLTARRPRRMVPIEQSSPADPEAELAQPLNEVSWLEPYPGDAALSPEARYAEREHVELAFVAALQHLPPNQRAALLLCEVLGFSAEEAAAALGASVPAVNSALQRARKALDEKLPPESRQGARAPDDDGVRRLIARFVSAWERADVDAIVSMLASDATFTMPPIPTWFRSRDDLRVFLVTRVFAQSWRFLPTRANGQHALACYMRDAAGAYPLSAINVFRVRGDEIAAIDAFLGPDTLARFGLPPAIEG